MNYDVFIDELERNSSLKIRDREAFCEAFKGLVNSCSGMGSEENDEEEDQDQGKGKGLPSVALILGKKMK